MQSLRPELLDGVLVVDLSNDLATAYCTKLFAAVGARVVMVEPSGGSMLRSMSSCQTPPDAVGTPLFHHMAEGKESLIGALGDPEVDALVRSADVIVESTLDIAALAAMRAANPGCVVVSITPYGRSGPWSGRPATDLTIQADSGAMKFRGPSGRPPLRSGGHLCSVMSGTAAAAAAMGALVGARSTGAGEHVDVAWLDVMAVAGSNYVDLQHSSVGRPEITGPMRWRDTPGIEQASDGLVGLNTNTGQMFQMFLVLIGRADLLDDPRYARLGDRIALGAAWQQIVDDWTTQRTVAEIIEAASELRIPVAPVHDGRTVLEDTQYRARGMFVERPSGRTGIATPFIVDGARRALGAAPEPGVHRPLEVERRDPVEARRAPGDLPLSGVRVIDLTGWWVGGLATQTLGALGAEVIHVESIQHPDGMRLTGWRPGLEEWWEWGHMFLAVSPNKLGITLDLSAEAGRELLSSLIATADVLVENYAPRVTEQWGLDVASVRRLNDGIVHVRMPGFGLTGPWRDRPAFAQIIEPMSTLASVTGYPGDRPVSKGGLPDPLAGWHGSFITLAGLFGALARGTGVTLETCMAETALHAWAEPALEWSASGTLLGLEGNRSHEGVPHGVYPARGTDEWVAICVRGDAEWAALIDVLGADGLDPSLMAASAETRRRAHDHIDDWIARRTELRDAAEVAERLAERGVPAGRCRDPRTLTEHPQLDARGVFEFLDHPVVGRHPTPTPPFRFSSIARWWRSATPTLGQHNVEVLGGILGLSRAELDQLEHDQVIGTRPIGL